MKFEKAWIVILAAIALFVVYIVYAFTLQVFYPFLILGFIGCGLLIYPDIKKTHEKMVWILFGCSLLCFLLSIGALVLIFLYGDHGKGSPIYPFLFPVPFNLVGIGLSRSLFRKDARRLAFLSGLLNLLYPGIALWFFVGMVTI